MEKVMEFVDGRMNELDRGIVATPHMEYLDAFAKANRGSNDFLLMQMAIQYGYKMAMEDIAEIVELQS
jgi:hypothetical protein